MENRSLPEKIKEKYAGLSRRQKLIADYCLEHSEKAVFMTAAELGRTLGTSESTVVRFAKALEYEGYPQMQRAMVACVKSRWEASSDTSPGYAAGEEPYPLPSGIADTHPLRAVISADIEKLKKTLQEIDEAAFETAVRDILEAEHVYVMGLRSCEALANFFYFYLHMIRPDTVLVKSTNPNEIYEQIFRIGAKDCFVGISFPRYSMQTLKAMEFANDRSARVIAVTDSVNSPMNLYSSCNLLAKSDMIAAADSLVAPMSVLNALIVAMCRKRPEAVKRNLDTLKEVWDNYQAGWNDEINMIDEDALEPEGSGAAGAVAEDRGAVGADTSEKERK